MLFARTHQPTRRGRELVAGGATLLDVRTREEYAEGHVQGALNIPVQELAARMHEVPSANRDVVVYCRSGGRSAMAAGMLRREGFRVEDIGPMSAW